jgi:membrane fusion protein (multidrug efflux system)
MNQWSDHKSENLGERRHGKPGDPEQAELRSSPAAPEEGLSRGASGVAGNEEAAGAGPAGGKPEGGFFRGHRVRLALVALLLLGLVAAAISGWRYFRSYVSTEDAQIDGNIVPLSSRIQGVVVRVYVHDTQFVKKGEKLVELDPRDYQIAVKKARADLAQAQAQAMAARADYAAAVADLTQARANDAKAQADARRYSALFASHVISREQYDEKIRMARVATAAAASARAKAEAAQKAVAVREAAEMTAEATLDQARLNLSYTVISAPVSGVVGNRTVQDGQAVQPGQGLLAITDINHLWVTANFKESYLGKIRPGQPATVHVDALGHDLNGYVEGLGGATGALYSLLPPENATGNWVKVVQRLPVRIRLAQGEDPPTHLRPGESAEVTIWLR